jgi:lipoprotein NlpD
VRLPRSLCLAGICCVLLGACADTGNRGPAVVVVAPQDTLYSIAWRYDLDYRDLARWNNLGADYRISVGQKLFMSPGQAPEQQVQGRRMGAPAATGSPRAGQGPAPAQSRGASAAGAGQPHVDRPIPLPEKSQTPTGTVARPPSEQPAPVDAGRPLRWVWPTDRIGAPRAVPGGGILISGKLGQEVRAAAAGRVVYAGSGLRSYGKLVIIKHGDNWLSAYAHNRELEVHEGQDVAAGQPIAKMGEAVRQIPVLYFEIRLNGRPVDPEPYLLGKK